MAELAGVSCAAGCRPIVGEVCWVPDPDGPPVPMCAAHAQADECGHDLIDLFDRDIRAVEVLDRLMRIPCPAARVVEAPPLVVNAEDREALDRLAPFRTGSV